ncbi:MAG: aminopeptidase P family protein [Chloroflexi bacterium]|nr:aminopeptidase P family protein [Chloroflexota bacterium]
MQDRDTTALVTERRERAAARWDLDRGVVLVPAGLMLPIAGTDQFHEYHAHPEHRYLAGVGQPGGVLAFDAGEGWTLFVPQPEAAERVWTGNGPSLAAVGDVSGLARVQAASELGGWLERRRGEPVAVIGNDDLTLRAGEYGVESWTSLEFATDEDENERLRTVVAELRRAKDANELALMREAAAATHRGHMAGLGKARAGMSERALQIEIEVEFFGAGAERTAYGSIVGGGPNAATLHFAPTAREFGEGELILVDAGAEVGGYASDVTRTYPVGARFEGVQRDLYELVLGVQERGIAGARPGIEYKELHLAASVEIARGLIDLGLLRGNAEGLVERDAQALFFPHGLGHMLGLATHDAGGCLEGRAPSDRPTLRYLRADLPLQPGYVVTIEPGIYFIRALLEDADLRERYRNDVDWGRVDELLDFGGIRIEDDVLVTEDEAEVLSAATPKSLEGIEALRAEALEA